MTGCRAYQELEAEKLSADIEELENSVKHLRRSNEELHETLKAAPGDEDFKTALNENEEVIEKRESLISDLKIQLRGLTGGLKGLAATHSGMPVLNTATAPVTTASSPVTVATERSRESVEEGGERTTTQEGAEGEAKQPEEAGVYL